ncbi:MAG: hypothetical protein AMXMBFR13_20750 [Phycisphaerae bacterium]
MQRSIVVLCGWYGAILVTAVQAEDPSLPDQSVQAMHRATEFFRSRVSTEGGYLWRYSEDLSRREGEGKASATMVWVQPPGTPSVGMAYLDAYEATGDEYFLKSATETAEALVRGQLRSGGWDYRIEFDPQQRKRYAYRVDGEQPAERNVSTLDDDTTQAALRCLMRVDEALGFKHERIHEAALYALTHLIDAQFPNGAWPQRFEKATDPSRYPVRKASYPDSWSRTFPDDRYSGYYTLNDRAIPDMIDTMLEAGRIYQEKRFRDSAERGGGFLLLAQMPAPQPAWAQQYDMDMHPAWARKFEPPAVTGGESQAVMRTLLMLYRETGDRKYLEPLPRALAYLRDSRLADGQLARFYELKTNRPLYFTREDYELTYSDADMPTHYSFKTADQTGAITREYERLLNMDPEELQATTRASKPRMSRGLEQQARAVIAALDEHGRWVEEGRLRYHGEDDPTRRIIDCQTFITNMKALSNYLAATQSDGARP